MPSPELPADRFNMGISHSRCNSRQDRWGKRGREGGEEGGKERNEKSNF